MTEWTWSGSGCKLLRYGAAADNTWSISRSCRFRCTARSPILLSSSFWSLKSWVNLYDEPLSFFLLSRQDLVKIWQRGGNTCLGRKQYTLYHTANKQPNKKWRLMYISQIRFPCLEFWNSKAWPQNITLLVNETNVGDFSWKKASEAATEKLKQEITEGWYWQMERCNKDKRVKVSVSMVWRHTRGKEV